MPIKQPNESDFELRDEWSSVLVTFKPTESHFCFARLADGGLSTVASVRHAKTGDTDQYIESDVGHLAARLAQQHARRR